MKGISPLIASVMMVAFTVVLVMVISGWYSTLTRTTTSNITAQTGRSIDCSVAGITIENVYLDTTANTTTAVVRNSGLVDNLTLTGGIVLNTTGSNCTYSSGLTTLNKGDVASVVFNECPIASCSVFSKAMILTDCGSVSSTWTATPTNC